MGTFRRRKISILENRGYHKIDPRGPDAEGKIDLNIVIQRSPSLANFHILEVDVRPGYLQSGER